MLRFLCVKLDSYMTLLFSRVAQKEQKITLHRNLKLENTFSQKFD